jgi:Methyltransferase domain
LRPTSCCYYHQMAPRTKCINQTWSITACLMAFAIACLVMLPKRDSWLRAMRTDARCVGLWDRKMKKHSQLIQHRRGLLARSTVFSERTVYDAFEPTYTCHSEYRRGKLLGDGGKFVCGEEQYFRALNAGGNRCLVYSVGSNGDASFEQAIVQDFGCEFTRLIQLETLRPSSATWSPPVQSSTPSALGVRARQ